MLTRIGDLLNEITSFSTSDIETLESFRLKYLSKKGIISELFEEFKKIEPEVKRQVGQKLNELKQTAQDKYNSLKNDLSQSEERNSGIDLSMPAYPNFVGTRHPISIVRNEIIDIFKRTGLTISEGPEIEDDDHVFTKLNFAPEHPARDMQDTFYISRRSHEDSSPQDILLRTHTSSVQVRVMQNHKPPIRTIS